MPKTFDPTKPCRTLDGRPARIICTDGGGPRPVIALLQSNHEDGDLIYRYCLDGSTDPEGGEPSGQDLENTPERHVLVLSVAQDETGEPYDLHPDYGHLPVLIGQVRVTVEDRCIVSVEILP